MLSLVIIATSCIVTLGVTSWLYAWVARCLGSPRGRFTVGLAAVLLMGVLNLAVSIAARAAYPAHLPALLLLAVCVVVVRLAIDYVVPKYVFNVSWRRAMALLGTGLAWSVLMQILALAVVRPFVVEAFVIPAGSMAPTLEPGSRVACEKLLSPHRWDIVVYRHELMGEETYFCKRLIGFPGEQLRCEHGTLYVNGKPATPPPVLAGRMSLTYADFPDPSLYHDGQTVTLGSDEYFVIGDNVARSADSRTYGPIHRSALVGVADLIYWPIDHFQVVR